MFRNVPGWQTAPSIESVEQSAPPNRAAVRRKSVGSLESAATMTKFRIVVVVCVALCFLSATPSVAQASEARCRQALLHDWYVDGQIQGQYRVGCYQATLADVPSGDMIYRTLRRDLSQALSSGIARVEQQGVTAKSETVLPTPHQRLAAPAITNPQKSHHRLFSLVAPVLLIVLLAAWCVARSRGKRLV
jgi:hypothetical protein